MNAATVSGTMVSAFACAPNAPDTIGKIPSASETRRPSENPIAYSIAWTRVIRLADTTWLARADLKERLDAVLDAFRAAGGRVT
jgi:hypothetical protein